MTKISDFDSLTRFNYQLLARLQQDCEYYLGAGARHSKHLWAQDEAAQIEKMKELYAVLPEKPEWVTLADIEKYETEMVSPVEAALTQVTPAKTPGIDMSVKNQEKTDVEPLLSLPSVGMNLNTGTVLFRRPSDDLSIYRMVEHRGDVAKCKEWVLNKYPDAVFVYPKHSFEVTEAELNDIPLVVSGRFVGPVVGTKDGFVIQDTGRRKLVKHDTSKFDTPPKAGDKLDVRYMDGLAKAADELSKDNHSVSVSMHTR